jgi:hypothetical protein
MPKKTTTADHIIILTFPSVDALNAYLEKLTGDPA